MARVADRMPMMIATATSRDRMLQTVADRRRCGHPARDPVGRARSAAAGLRQRAHRDGVLAARQAHRAAATRTVAPVCRAGSRSSPSMLVIVGRPRPPRPAGHSAARRAGRGAVGEAARPSSTEFQTFLISHKLMVAPRDARRGGAERAERHRRQRRRHGARRDLEPDRRRLRADHDPDSDLLPADRSAADVRLPGALRAARPPRRRGDRGAPGGREGQRVAARAVHPGRRDGHFRRDRPRR